MTGAVDDGSGGAPGGTKAVVKRDATLATPIPLVGRAIHV